MSTQTLPEKKTSAVVKNLRTVLADSYALMGQTHLAHWNVEGPAFFSLHQAFEAQYTELFAAVDELAERIRALDHLSPGGLSTLAKLSSITEMAVDRAPAKDFVAHLIECNETVIASLVALREAASDSDPETQDVAIKRIQTHEKAVWMMRAFLKNL